jgi:hypothetical protein
MVIGTCLRELSANWVHAPDLFRASVPQVIELTGRSGGTAFVRHETTIPKATAVSLIMAILSSPF